MTRVDRAVRTLLRNPVFATSALALAALSSASAFAGDTQVFFTGDLVVSSSTYGGTASTVSVGQALPYNDAGYGAGVGSSNLKASYNGSFSQVFNNDATDANFGITSAITLSDLTTSGNLVDSITLNSSSAQNTSNGIVTSFSSKSELSLNLSTNGSALTFMGYTAPVNTLDVSNSNTPGVIDNSNSDTQAATYRAIGTIDAYGNLTVTPTNAYSGNNGRAAILDNSTGTYYMVGNAGNSDKSNSYYTKGILDTLSANTGVQMIQANSGSPNTTVVGKQVCPTCVGTGTGNQYGYSITANGNAADKTGKDDNFRGLTIGPNNTLYVSKGSGSNGINSVYQVGSGLPTAATASSTTITNTGVSTTLASSTTGTIDHPFGVWFANSTTAYVADEGDQASTDVAGGTTAGSNTGGLQKWTLNNGTWTLDYTLTSGLNLGQDYGVTGSVGGDSGTETQFTDGLRNLTGKVNSDGSVTLYAVTSTYGGTVTTSSGTNAIGDDGAESNKLVAVNDLLSDTTLSAASSESFTTLETASYGEVLRGVSFAPTSEVPLPAAVWLFGSGVAGLGALTRRRKSAQV